MGACPGGTSAPDAAFIPPPVGQFPSGFLWGTAIAPYQVEGGLHASDWYQWESRCTNCSDDSADNGPNFWNQYEIDLANAAAMHTNAIRIGIEWSRVFPTATSFPNAPDPAAVTRYHEIIDSARAKGMTVMVTLHHFSTPVWLLDLDALATTNGWEDAQMVAAFTTFAGWAAEEFGADVDWWITINEPFAYIAGGYLGGLFPPGYSLDTARAVTVLWNMIDGHASAYEEIHSRDLMDADGDGAEAMVSIAQHSRVFLPRDPADATHVRAADMTRLVNNRVFLDAIVFGDEDRNFDGDLLDTGGPDGDRDDDTSLRDHLDFIGLNYYGVSIVLPGSESDLPFVGLPFGNDLDRYGLTNPISDYGWSIYPEGFRVVLDELAPYSQNPARPIPIVITENGVADRDEVLRSRFLLDHLYALADAIDDGIDIRGYFHWSLIDNFEWMAGYCPQFGLYRVDLASPERDRTAGAAVDVYRQIIDANTVPVELYATHAYGTSTNACPRYGF